MKTAYGYDRVRVWFDVPDVPISLRPIRRLCNKAKVTYGQMYMNAMWCCKLELHQPSLECLQLLAKHLRNGTSTHINYVEIAQDVLADNPYDASRWNANFLKAARMRYQHKMVLQSEEGMEKGAHYFGRRADPNTLAVYHDNPSKLNVKAVMGNANPCLHIEWRASRSAALQSLGLVSVEDLINFDHAAFWASRLHFYRMPRRGELGRVLAQICGGRTEVSAAALRKRANNWTAEHSDSHGNFILHNALLGDPNVASCFERITIDDWKDSLN